MTQPDLKECLPKRCDIYSGGAWQKPISGRYSDTLNPANGAVLASVAEAGDEDADAVVNAD